MYGEDKLVGMGSLINLFFLASSRQIMTHVLPK